MASDAVGLELVSRVVGYKLTKGDFSDSTPNLPQRVAVLCEANTANQSATLTTPTRILSAQQAGEAYGWGSPAHIIARILFPVTGGGLIGGIPVIFYPQDEAVGATAKELELEITGSATDNATHFVVVDGRYSLDGDSYAFTVERGDTNADIALKIYNVVNNVLGSPVTATLNSPVDEFVTFTSKWKGLTANGINIRVDTNGNDAGVSYAVTSTASGAGTPSVGDALALFGNEWITNVINSYGFNTSVMAELQSFNGIPDITTPTGRYYPTIFKPFIALTGTVLNTQANSQDTVLCENNKTQVTIAACPAPLSEGLAMEAAANYTALFARTTQDAPHLDIAGKYLPDMPMAIENFAQQSYTVRDACVKLGMSTVDKVAGQYQVQDFVTTYHPVGEMPPQFRWCRNIMLDCNVRYGYFLLEQSNVVDHVIANDNDVVTATNVVKPKIWKGIVSNYANDLVTRGLVADAAFMQNSIVVNISTVNPDRLETFFRYKRTGIARIASTTAEAGFNFGTAQ